MHDIYRTDKLSTDMGENYVIFIAPLNKWNLISRFNKVRHQLWTCLRRSGSFSRWQRRTMPLLFATHVQQGFQEEEKRGQVLTQQILYLTWKVVIPTKLY